MNTAPNPGTPDDAAITTEVYDTAPRQVMDAKRPAEPLTTDTLELWIGRAAPTRLKLRVAPLLTVGRLDDHNPVDLDLTPHGAFQHGVSRRHAQFVVQGDGIFVKDLGSTNGTRINGFGLVPDRPYRLRNGDELEFGRLCVTVRFKS